jgi:hypothetical protein
MADGDQRISAPGTGKPARLLTGLLLGCWGAAVLAGMVVVQKYKLTPGGNGAVAARWPAQSALTRADHQAQLVMFAHPRCPCTRASLTELSRLLAHDGRKLVTDVVIVLPAGAPADWSEGDTAAAARGIPGVRITLDPDGREAARFGAATSGHALLYDADGKLRFSGGITPARAHEGDTPGLQRISALLRGEPVGDRLDTPVFGCALGQARASGPLA